MKITVGYFTGKILAPLAICGLLAEPAMAEEQSLGEIEIRAGAETRAGTGAAAAYDSAAFTSVITARDLEGRRTNLSEVLEEQAGVQVKRRGGLDDFATVSIRGSTSEQVAVYVDGIPLGQGQGGSVNVASIPTDQIERIEVYKGAAPARFQTSAIGGVVNIVTKKAGRGRETRLSASYGSFNTIEGTLLQSQRFERTAYQAGYTYTRSSGDFTFESDNGTPFNPDDDRVEKRRNNEFARHNLLTKFDWRNFSFNNQFFREDRGIPGLGTLTSETADLSTTRNAFSVEIRSVGAQLIAPLQISLIPFFQYQKQQFTDRDGDIGLGTQDNDNDTFQYGSSILAETPAGRHQRLTATLDYRGEQFLPEDFARTPSSQPHSVRNTASFGLEDEIYLWDERLILNPSVRTEHIFDTQAGAPSTAHHPVSGKVGVKVQPWGGDGIAVFKTNFSRGFRIPSFSELFGDRGTFVGNPSLEPEKSLNWDIGGIFRIAPVRLEISYYLNHIDDLIQLVQTSQFTVQAQNLTKARIQGAEATVSATLFDHLDLAADYTFQWAKDVSGLPGLDGNFLPGRPRHEASAKAAYFTDWSRVFTDVTFQDGNFLDTQNVLRVDHRVLLGAGFSITYPKRLTWGFEGKNLLNDRIEDVVGFPLPGRSFFGKVELKI
ncbi:MAG TPA: TonB-dependent receptor [bacterium]|nr:TonB-dependent receptor [bacterium]